MAQDERKIITYNTAMQFSIPQLEQRRRNLLRGLKALSADVACLQEVYDGSDLKWLLPRLKKTYPYSFSFKHETVTTLKAKEEPPCNRQKITEFLGCVSSHCSGFNTSIHEDRVSLLLCLQAQCAAQVFSLSQDCLTCFFLRTDLIEAANECLNPQTTINVPGLLLFSKHKIISASAVEHHPGFMEIAKQGYLLVDIDTIGTVVCTHLAVPFLGDLYPEAALPFTSYVEQNLAEVKNLLTVINGTTPLVLAGDFNTGPSQPDIGICEQSPDSYRILNSSEANLTHTILDNCTYCTNNTWTENECDLTIDHIFLRGHTFKETKIANKKELNH
ncbi:hypothetical protein CHS0354_002173 [Potamilus streckersoni]|uniref:Endonuclease/exonuclease/phosphatase domain-containing protein n=1 Tax=Potamilus streckersoni TaxID=2493646 RepID=A0AAE0RS43_9BIVA|nr:hypothetical protein CHS0354_002173 [Potamilus streckersoni]